MTLNLDFPADDLDLEVWFDGQTPGNKMLGALFAEIERKGERKRPEIDLDFRTAPKKWARRSPGSRPQPSHFQRFGKISRPTALFSRQAPVF